MAVRSLSLDVKVGDSLAIDGGKILVTLLHKSGQLAKLAFVADDSISIVKGKKSQAGAEQAKKGLTP
jgi:hypothetical protein